MKGGVFATASQADDEPALETRNNRNFLHTSIWRRRKSVVRVSRARNRDYNDPAPHESTLSWNDRSQRRSPEGGVCCLDSQVQCKMLARRIRSTVLEFRLRSQRRIHAEGELARLYRKPLDISLPKIAVPRNNGRVGNFQVRHFSQRLV